MALHCRYYVVKRGETEKYNRTLRGIKTAAENNQHNHRAAVQ